MNDVTAMFWPSWCDRLQSDNEAHGFYCYGKTADPDLFALWREADDQQLTPWLPLGDMGMIGVIHQQDDEVLLKLMSASEDGRYPCRLGLMHLPSGRETGLIFDPEVSEALIKIDWVAHPPWFVLTGFDEMAGQGVISSIYDHRMNCLLSQPLLMVIRCFEPQYALLLAINAGGASRYGLLFMQDQRLGLPFDYVDIFAFEQVWIGITPEGSSHIWDQYGQSHYVLPCVLTIGDSTLLAQKEGYWQQVDLHGNTIGTMRASSVQALLAQGADFSGLNLPAANAMLTDEMVTRLSRMSIDGGTSHKYEGLPEPFYDDYLDIGAACLSPHQDAILIALRHAGVRWLLLPEDGAAGQRGAIWRLHADTEAVGLSVRELDELLVLLEWACDA